jgi:hypothetical protein
MKKHFFTTLALAALSLAGCASPAIGDWRSSDTVANEHNEMKLEDDLSGEATVYFYLDDEPYFADYDVTWEDEGDTIAVDLECKGDCASFDFKMDCELNDDEDEMECDGDGAFRDYVFEWKRD